MATETPYPADTRFTDVAWFDHHMVTFNLWIPDGAGGEFAHWGRIYTDHRTTSGMYSLVAPRILAGWTPDRIRENVTYMTQLVHNINLLSPKLDDLTKRIDNPSHWARLPKHCLLYTSPSPRDRQKSRMPSSA